MTKNNELLGAVAQWARAKGIPRPTSKEGMQALFAEFLAEQPAWYEIAGDKPTQLLWNGVSTQIVDELHGEPDDFDLLVEKRQEMLARNDGDALRAEVGMMDHDRAKLVAAAESSGNTPSSAVGSVLGSQATVSSKADSLTTVAYWQGLDTETRPVTITAAPVLQAAGTGNPNFFRPFAKISFGTRAFSSAVFVDICKGVQLTLTASAVTVDVGLEINTAHPEAQMTLTAMLSFGPIAKGETPATRTLYKDSTFLTSPTFVVPPYAKRVWFFRQDPAGAVTLSFNDANATTQYTVAIAANANMTSAIPIADDINTIDVVFTAPGSPGRMIFELSM